MNRFEDPAGLERGNNHDSSNRLPIVIYPEILGVEFFTLRYLRVLRGGDTRS
jgi:hypothetical protein